MSSRANRAEAPGVSHTPSSSDPAAVGGRMSMTDVAIAEIKSMIVSGQLRPGDRLPPEAPLASSLGLSRNSLREAVRALSLMNILEVRRGDGTYVSSLEPRLLLEPLTFVNDLHRDETMLELLGIRRVLEPVAVEAAASRITDEALAHLGRLVEELHHMDDVEDLVRNDVDFHRCIAEASGNHALASLLDGLAAPTQRARIWRGRSQHGALERTKAEHASIYRALVDRDAGSAKAWAEIHVAGVERWLTDHLRDRTDAG